MNVEWSASVMARAKRHAALGDPARLAIVDRLLLGDASPGELGQELGLPSNLLAHHLKLLDQVGLIERSRSEGDGRRTYLHLRTQALADTMPTPPRTALRVVFVCTHNSARSHLAAALWKRQSAVPAASAGTKPAQRVHPRALATARAHGLSLTPARTAHIDDTLRPDDLVVAVCDNAHEQLGTQVPDRLHWSVPDPTRTGTDDAFADALSDLPDRVDRLAPAVHPPGGSDD
ncbi:helix-turn-helix domain-containing protein [Streptomyces sp. NPDC048275]|uniref:arsenate reductase/protein-tyrosine-phosphatase family protein n=1 Tax=Streptomyces sp. NPDC048275 TaxID=3155629 RepID=UPI00340199FC